ncbi:hypothetical protein [Mycobacterium sp. shizuoka-1]|uniref:hypothetical protein n=1 Tax=Mycobacterium sp. shizuoka-1 TaxID=2039281 RepID=UPI000C06197B|nr:hypothetical protein [Mycobacterium sp. shizuoka-1]GAY18133.1 hypothetical protein MSZK_48590 [Mycobacterium sp. shizuoka-1]
MGHPGCQPYPGHPPQAPPPRSAADLAISIVLMVLTVVIGAGGAVLGLFSLAFLDYCPPATCSVSGAVTAVTTAVGIAAAVGLVGIIVTIVALARRKRAWPFAVGTIVLCLAALIGGGAAYSAAVGG